MRARRGKPVVGGDVLNGRAKQGQKYLDDKPGPAEQGVITVCENNTVADERPDLVAQARILARLLVTQLVPVAKTKSKGRLVAIKKMTNRRPPEGVSG